MNTLKLDVRHDLKAYKRGLTQIEKRQLPKAAQAALNRAGSSTKGTAVKAIAKLMGLKQGRVKRAVVFIKSTFGKLVAFIEARGRPLNLISFTSPGETRAKARVRGGVRAKAGGRSKTFKGTFIGNAGKTVFRRRSKRRTDIVGVSGGSIPETMAAEAVEGAIRTKFFERWPVEFERAFNRFVKGS